MKISIVTVVFNQKKYLKDCIESIYGQIYQDIEYIVVDGGSTDGTLEIIKENEKMIDKWISEEDRGIYDAMNKGIRMASGEVVGFLHANDLFYSRDIIDKISKVFNDKDIDGCYGDLIYMNKDLSKRIRLWKAGEYERSKLKNGWMLPHPTFYLRKVIYEKNGLYNTSFKISADYEIMLRLLEKRKIRLYYLSEIMTIMRVGGISNWGFKNLLLKSFEDYKAWKVNNLKITPFVVIKKPMNKIKQFFFK